jgi:uncharacterized membrane protein
MKLAVRYFAQGALVIVPVAATLYVVYWIVSTLDGWLSLGFPGAGFALALVLITLVGFFTSNVIGASLVGLVEKVLSRLPLIRIVYNSIKDLASAFVGDKKGFDTPVAVSLPGAIGVVFGFQTSEQALPVSGLEDHVAVYLPQSYNFSGNLVMVPKSSVTPLSVQRADFMTFIVSGGVSGAVTPITAGANKARRAAN